MAKPLIPEEFEDWFHDDLELYWLKGLSAKEIIAEMFEPPDKLPWGLKLEHIYYFVDKYGLPKRRNLKKPKPPKDAVRWTPDMPQHMVEHYRKQGLLLNDPQNT